MDALREQYEGGFKMSAYKDKTQGTWYVSFRYIDWTGKKTQKLKRGFKTKKEALNYEKEFIRKTAADMKMEMNSFIQVYFEDKKNELKENSIRNKQHMLNKHIVPYFGTRKMNEITPAMTEYKESSPDVKQHVSLPGTDIAIERRETGRRLRHSCPASGKRAAIKM